MINLLMCITKIISMIPSNLLFFFSFFFFLFLFLFSYSSIFKMKNISEKLGIEFEEEVFFFLVFLFVILTH